MGEVSKESMEELADKSVSYIMKRTGVTPAIDVFNHVEEFLNGYASSEFERIMRYCRDKDKVIFLYSRGNLKREPTLKETYYITSKSKNR